MATAGINANDASITVGTDIIVSAPNWKELEPKINSAFQTAVRGDHEF